MRPFIRTGIGTPDSREYAAAMGGRQASAGARSTRASAGDRTGTQDRSAGVAGTMSVAEQRHMLRGILGHCHHTKMKITEADRRCGGRRACIRPRACHRSPMTTTPTRRGSGPPPDAATLHDAALAHLARYATTEAGLRRVLERRVERWARIASSGGADRETVADQAAVARNLVRAVVTRLVAAAAVNDVTFAQSRSRSLTRAGRSRRAVVAHLAAKGVDSAAARAVLPEDAETELAAALVLARRRRIGPFRQDDAKEPAQRLRELAILARAGFPQDVARRALSMDHAAAEALVIQLRR